MSEMLGMDVAQVREFAQTLARSAADLDRSRGQLDRMVRGMQWVGPDAKALRARWDTRHRVSMETASRLLHEAVRALLQEATEQERASDVGGGWSPGGIVSWLGGAAEAVQSVVGGAVGWVNGRIEDGLDWVSDGIDWVGGRVGEAVAGVGDWLGARVDDVLGFVVPRLEAAVPALVRLGNALGIRANLILRIFTEGRLPQLSELLASELIVLATTAGIGMNLAAGEDVGFFEPGSPWGGQPSLETSAVLNQPTTDMVALTASTMAAYGPDYDGAIRVEAVTGADGVTRYIVSVPGTEGDLDKLSGYTHNANAHNWAANAYALAQGSDATNSQAVIMAIRNSVPPGSEVLLTGHSQGGIIASNIAADPGFRGDYRLAGVVGWGAPMDCADIPESGPMSVPVLDIQHGGNVVAGPSGIPRYDIGDVVPKLDLGGVRAPFIPESDSNVTHVNLPSKGPFTDPWANHGQEGYAVDMANLSGANADAVNGFVSQNGLDRFFVTDGATSTVYTVPFGG